MANVINDKVVSQKLNRHLNQARRENVDSLEKLSSGQIFTTQDPRPADRALAEGLEFKLRSLSASKRNINDAVSLLQTAESGFSEVNNILTRLKEINVAAAATTMTNQERKFLFIEYQALYDEMNRIAQTTEFNGIPLLNGENEKTPESLIFRVDDPYRGDDAPTESGDWNEIRFENLRDVIANPDGLGLRSVREYLEDEEGIDLETAQELLEPEDSDLFSTIYDEALDRLSGFRATYGAMQTRLQKAMDYASVFEENIAAAKSRIADTDYAEEVSRLTQNNVLMQATTSLLAQNNFNASMAMRLINSIS